MTSFLHMTLPAETRRPSNKSILQSSGKVVRAHGSSVPPYSQRNVVARCAWSSVAMEAELLGVETRLSERPAQEANDTTALTREQQSQLDRHKVTLRIQNELYLRKHPELHSLLSSFVSEVLLKQPESIREFAAESGMVSSGAGYFSDPGLLRQRHSVESDPQQIDEP